MSKLLYIKANIKPEGQSRAFQVADKFVEEYKVNHKEDEVIVLDLYKEDIDFLRAEDLGAVFGPKDEESRNHPILKYAYQFAEADKYVIAAPMWNLSIPAILKAYIDYVSIKDITFKYTAEGPVGLCQGKEALLVSARGGDYSTGIGANFEMGERYMKTVLGFFGIVNVESITLDNLDVQGIDVQAILNTAIAEATEIAKKF